MNLIKSKFHFLNKILIMFKNKLIIVPTLKIKFAIFMTRFVPNKLLLRINYHIQNVKIRKYNNK